MIGAVDFIRPVTTIIDQIAHLVVPGASPVVTLEVALLVLSARRRLRNESEVHLVGAIGQCVDSVRVLARTGVKQ